MLGKLLAAYRRSARKARAISELRAMAPHLLRDVGISPDQIEAYVSGRAGPSARC